MGFVCGVCIWSCCSLVVCLVLLVDDFVYIGLYVLRLTQLIVYCGIVVVPGFVLLLVICCCCFCLFGLLGFTLFCYLFRLVCLLLVLLFCCCMGVRLFTVV